ncbi:BgTH12-03805 [Blumeria graminis f. sp. triticale]|uniref:BgTH12-03805 n=1 Tax=Blumeria graminis f. sp. triticale TaxID=1689686 RepID=A0A9W4D0G8_BLUGR|nr:BgTH12-03805 [Blumeria graminis f. sp. triticale]
MTQPTPRTGHLQCS